ncbi:MAG: hypothetical protein LBE25_00955 [Arthrobacter sp.]|jgi:hypothetical protein|nr:hypothetical protein [Arthrobacter sp.]
MRIGSAFDAHVTATQGYIFSEGHGRAPRERSARGDLAARSHQILRELDGERRTPWENVVAVYVRPLRWHWWVPFAALPLGIVFLIAAVGFSLVSGVVDLAVIVAQVVRGTWNALTGAQWREDDRTKRLAEGNPTPRDLRIHAKREARKARAAAKEEAAEAKARVEAEREAAALVPVPAGAAAGGVGGFGGWAPPGPAPKEELNFDLGAPWGKIAVRVVTVDGPVDVLVRQRLFVRTTRADAAALEARYAALIADPALRASLPDRDR